jgi:hypothetical protein
MPDAAGFPSSQTYTYENKNCSDFDYEFELAPAVKCAYSGISLNMKCTLTKGNATWKFEFVNSITG